MEELGKVDRKPQNLSDNAYLHIEQAILEGTLTPCTRLMDLEGTHEINAASIHSRAGWSPYEGRTCHGPVMMTYLRGDKIAEQGRCVAPPGTGRLIPGRGLS